MSDMAMETRISWTGAGGEQREEGRKRDLRIGEDEGGGQGLEQEDGRH